MPKPHFYRPIRDAQGNALIGASVRLLQPGTTTLISSAIFTDSAGLESLGNPWVTDDGVIDFYCNESMVVDIGVTPAPPAEAVEVIYHDVVVIRKTPPLNPTFGSMVYDGDDNLTSWVEDGIAYAATYDAETGNLATLTVEGVTRTFAYDGSGRMTGAS